MADGSFQVNGKTYSLPTEFTLGEMCDAEKHFGVELNNQASSGARLAAALIWIAISRDDPTVTPEDIRDLPTSVLETFADEGDASPPPEDNAGKSGPSGHASNTTSESPGAIPNGSGDLGSATGSISALATSRT